MSKTLMQMATEVEKVNREKGWYDDDRTFGEMIALLHSEVSEALEAYRHWGLADATRGQLLASRPEKPEGVGSEFADVLIRLLDDALRWGIDIDDELAKLGPGKFLVPNSFGDQITNLHTHITYVVLAHDDVFTLTSDVGAMMARVLVYLRQLSDFHGIDLEAEYERKLAYNRTRPYRHGGKKL
jgi:NTP pyrophosphatase (non-canonical NTP hydrolase)